MRFSNEFSSAPVIIKEAHIAASAGGSAIDTETDRALAFDGKPAVTINPGATATSAPLTFPLKPRSDINGVHWLIILEGINDIGQAEGKEGAEDVAKNLIAAYERMIDLAHERGILVYGATLLPFGGSFYDNRWRESARQTVNNWIRSSGRFDAVIDLDKALRDPANPVHMLHAADTGDHLHPNETGHRMMAEAIDLKLFQQGFEP